MEPPSVLSCFSGIGGLDLGLEASGFASVGCIELDAMARDVLSLNRPAWPVLTIRDVVEAGSLLKPEDLGLQKGDLGLLAGGPPCQPFSKAAQWAAPRPGIEDVRGTTVGGMMALTRSFLPKALLIENVSGFLSGRNNARAIIENELADINGSEGTSYKLLSWLVNSADFGVPQHRRRTIAVAFREPVLSSLTIPTPFADSHRTTWDALGDLRGGTEPAMAGKYADLLPSIPEGWNYQWLTAAGGGSRFELFGYRTRFWSFLLKLAKDKPSWTLSANVGPSTGPFHWDNRPLATQERLALQGFPLGWKLTGNIRVDNRLTGNATPVALAESAGRLIQNLISEPTVQPIQEDITATTATLKRGDIPPPSDARELPARWKALVGPKQSHPGPGLGPAGQSLVK